MKNNSSLENYAKSIDKNEIFSLMEELYPICRSITGEGVRKSLKILKKIIGLNIFEVNTGTKVFDWKVPNEWNIKDAYVKNKNGKKIIDFKKSNIHLVSYSVPVNEKISLKDLKKHLHSLPKKPNSIPYVTSYYKENWGFCLADNKLKLMKDDYYDVKINSSLKPGSLTYGEYFKKGKISDEVLISVYICHPSLCHDNLSGVVVSTIFAKILAKINTYYSYRFIFIPETIGAITWLSKNKKNLSKIKHGLVITCVGSGNYITYKKTRDGNSRIDNVVIETLKETKKDFQIREFYPFGSDERQFCSPGINLPVGVLMRTPYYEYKEYHTADDNLKFIKKKHLNSSLITLCKIISKLENEKNNEKPKNKKIIKLKHDTYLNLKPNCEPQLGRRKLFTMKGAAFGTDKNESENIRQLAIFWLLNFSDGMHSLRDIAKKSDLSLPLLKKSAKRLVEKKLLKKLA